MALALRRLLLSSIFSRKSAVIRMQQQTSYLLEVDGIVKQFPGVLALNQAQLKLRPGTVHALMGENGAGKSTLMKCLFGIYKRMPEPSR